MRRDPMPFRFENMWLKKENFKDKVQTCWEVLSFKGSSSFMLTAKLKALNILLKGWNRLDFSKVEVNKALALNQVDFYDKVELSLPLTVHELEARREVNEDFKK